MVKNRIMILVGKSACGKTTILRKLSEELNLKPWVSYTTRPIRPKEIDGVDYHFCDVETFKSLNIIDERHYNTLVCGKSDTWYYGHEDEPNNNDIHNFIVISDVTGLKNLIEHYGRKRIYAVYINSNDDLRRKRCEHRGDFDESEWNRRLEDDEKVFADIESLVDLTVNNNSNLDIVLEGIAYNYFKWLKESIVEQVYGDVEQFQMIIRDTLETTNMTKEQATTLTTIFKDLVNLIQREIR